jgi:hypothetical protein
MRRMTLTASFLLAFGGFAHAEDEATYAKADIPKAVAAVADCDIEPDSIRRERFADGWLWKWPCPGNHANHIQAHIFSRDSQGADAARMRFPTPHKGERAWLGELSNSEFFPAAREFNHLFVDPEDNKICRTEARWIARNPAKPELVFWRETKDCEGKKDWRVLVNKKK